jgi:hypothetical protein
MTALGTRCGIGAGFFGVERITPDAVKSDLATLDIIERSITAIIIEPKCSE